MSSEDTYVRMLRLLDKDYFNYLGAQPVGRYFPGTLEEASKHLAGWFYEKPELRKMVTELPEELWMLTLKVWSNE